MDLRDLRIGVLHIAAFCIDSWGVHWTRASVFSLLHPDVLVKPPDVLAKPPDVFVPGREILRIHARACISPYFRLKREWGSAETQTVIEESTFVVRT